MWSKVYYKSGMTLCVPRSFSCHFEMLNVWTSRFFFFFWYAVQGTRLLRCLTNIFINEHLWCADEPCSMVNLYQGPLEHACLHSYYVMCTRRRLTEYGKPAAHQLWRDNAAQIFTYKPQQNTQSTHEHTHSTYYYPIYNI